MSKEQTEKKIFDTLSAEKQKLPLSIHFLKIGHLDPNEETNDFHLLSKTQMTERYRPSSFYKSIAMLFDLSSHEQDTI